MTNEVFQSGANFVANRKINGVYFSQYCHARHTYELP
jgi:hypothetical protein